MSETRLCDVCHIFLYRVLKDAETINSGQIYYSADKYTILQNQVALEFICKLLDASLRSVNSITFSYDDKKRILIIEKLQCDPDKLKLMDTVSESLKVKMLGEE